MVEGFDGVEGESLGFQARRRGMTVQALGLPRGEEALDAGVVAGVAGAAPAGLQAVGVEQAAVFFAGGLAATVAEPSGAR